MARLKDRHRSLAREAFWDEHDKDSYECPGCGRKHRECDSGIEVHHKSGHPLDNRADNLTGMCRVCHMLDEGKKPAMKHIRELRDDFNNTKQPSQENGDVPRIERKQTWYQKNPQTGELMKVKDVHTPEIPHEIELFIQEFVNTDPKDERWVNPWGLWWDEYERRFGTEDISPAELLWGLQEIAGAEIETEENDHGQDILLVYGVSL